MIRRPWPIVILALAHILAPIFNLFLGAYIINYPFDAYLEEIFVLDRWPKILSHFALLPLAGIAIYITKKWSYYVFIAIMIIIVFLNFKEHQLHPASYSLGLLILFLVTNVFVVSYFLVPSVSHVYMDGRQRWWEQKPRYNMGTPENIFVAGKQMSCTLENISESGAKLNPSAKFDQSQPLELEVSNGTTKIRVPFEVVHTYQGKLGTRFLHNSETQKIIKNYVKDIAAAGKHPRVLVPPWYESFIEWVKTLFTTGKGVFPESKK